MPTAMRMLYHLYGHIRNDTFELSHSSGHHFAGRLVSPDEMEGSVKISKGPKLSLSGKRVLNAPLAASDWALPFIDISGMRFFQ